MARHPYKGMDIQLIMTERNVWDRMFRRGRTSDKDLQRSKQIAARLIRMRRKFGMHQK